MAHKRPLRLWSGPATLVAGPPLGETPAAEADADGGSDDASSKRNCLRLLFIS